MSVYNRKFFILLLPLCFNSLARDGYIEFTGNVINNACIVNSETLNQNVDMGKISASAFSSAGQVSSATRFAVKVSNCPESVSLLHLTLSGQADATNPALLALDGSSTASGLGIAIYNQDSTVLIPLYSSVEHPIAGGAAEETFNFIAKYMSTSAAVKPGIVNAVSDFSISYN